MNEILVETFEDVFETPTSKKEIDDYNAVLIDLGLEHMTITHEDRRMSKMSELERRVYEMLCPTKIEIEKYKETIPIRVLEAFKSVKSFLEDEAKSNNKQLEVFIRIDSDPDPIMIAKTDWSTYYLIGRWGLELHDFPTLLKRAKERALSGAMKNIERMKSYNELYNKDPEAFAMAIINKNLDSMYW